METGRQMLNSQGPSFGLRYTQELDLPKDFSETAVCEGPVICPRTQFKDA